MRDTGYAATEDFCIDVENYMLVVALWFGDILFDIFCLPFA